MKKVLIKNGTIVTATDEFKGDLLLADGKIAAIGGAIDASSADEVYDAEGKYVMPGGVDQHTHFDFSFGDTTCAVSYTHLDVYKRQVEISPPFRINAKIARMAIPMSAR